MTTRQFPPTPADDEPSGGDATIGAFLMAGADDLWRRANKLADLSDADKAYWLEERELVRSAVRLLRRCDDELTFRLTGQRILHGRFYDEQRSREAEPMQLHSDETPVLMTNVVQVDRRNLETSLAESEAEAEQRRFTDRER